MFEVMDLFSGIGGFSLGLERTGGFKTTSFCEIDPFCRKVLKKHWPDVPCHEDITTREFTEGEADVITAGFPCQDISNAGLRAGITGERSGLWRHVVRAIRLVRPRLVSLENVAAILGRGLGVVLGDLAESGYDAEWDCIPAAYVHAKHIRDRCWILAYPCGDRLEGPIYTRNSLSQAGDAYDRRAAQRVYEPLDESFWKTESPVLGKDDAVSYWVDRVRALGNAVVPQIPELIGRSILQATFS